MARWTTLKKAVTKGIFVAGLTALIGFQATGLAAQGQRLFSIVAHFQYEDGFEFDYVVQRGVSGRELGAALGECGASHWTKQVVKYHCYAAAE